MSGLLSMKTLTVLKNLQGMASSKEHFLLSQKRWILVPTSGCSQLFVALAVGGPRPLTSSCVC